MSVTYAATLLVVVAVPPQGLRRARRTGNLPLLRLSTLVARVGSGTRHPRGVAARTARSCAGDGRGSVDPSTWREGGRARGVWWREARRASSGAVGAASFTKFGSGCAPSAGLTERIGGATAVCALSVSDTVSAPESGVAGSGRSRICASACKALLRRRETSSCDAGAAVNAWSSCLGGPGLVASPMRRPSVGATRLSGVRVGAAVEARRLLVVWYGPALWRGGVLTGRR